MEHYTFSFLNTIASQSCIEFSRIQCWRNNSLHLKTMNEYTITLSMHIKFWMLVVLSTTSAFCAILVLSYFYRNRRNILLHHHLTMALVLTSLIQMTTELPLSMIFYSQGVVISSKDALCTWWNFWDYTTQGIGLFLMAWGSLDRHLLIFHARMLNTKWKRIVFHALPIVIAILFNPVFYFFAIIVNTCEAKYDFYMVSSDYRITLFYSFVHRSYVVSHVIRLLNVSWLSTIG